MPSLAFSVFVGISHLLDDVGILTEKIGSIGYVFGCYRVSEKSVSPRFLLIVILCMCDLV